MDHDKTLYAASLTPPPTAPTTTTTYTDTTPPPTEVTVNYFYDNLAPYGSWVEVEGYGRCWRPTAVIYDSGWRPYCDRGHWVYTDCGWYWDSDYSWGATFHYGRWFRHSRYGWCWYPGGIGFGGRHYWSPALVAFVGFGHGGFGFGHVGWVPLAPYERFHPWYGRGYSGGTRCCEKT